jgi:hypothetical protein
MDVSRDDERRTPDPDRPADARSDLPEILDGLRRRWASGRTDPEIVLALRRVIENDT